MNTVPLISYIYVTFQREGIHCYPEAATDPGLQDVSFLSYPHRHIFHFEVYLEVKHGNRDVEFIQFKRWLQSLYTHFSGTEKILQLDNLSCEMISDKLAARIKAKYPNRKIKIKVSEDNENGSYAEYA